ncbi:hypothetical protein A2U01_0059155, partial [Trifolium medium]|nr:hypothetical protein [Trifolium medium]
MAIPDASVSKINGLVKLGRAKVGAVVMASLRALKAMVVSGFQWNESLCKREVRGAAIEA